MVHIPKYVWVFVKIQTGPIEGYSSFLPQAPTSRPLQLRKKRIMRYRFYVWLTIVMHILSVQKHMSMHVHRYNVCMFRVRKLQEQQINKALIQHLRFLAYTSLLPLGTAHQRLGERHRMTEWSREREREGKGKIIWVGKEESRGKKRDQRGTMNYLLVHSSLLFFFLYSSSSCSLVPISLIIISSSFSCTLSTSLSSTPSCSASSSPSLSSFTPSVSSSSFSTPSWSSSTSSSSSQPSILKT